jgi:hypothetical protein
MDLNNHRNEATLALAIMPEVIHIVNGWWMNSDIWVW